MPIAMPTWRNVSLMPEAMPLCSLGTTETATSATAGLMRPTPTPARMKPGSSAGPLLAGVEAAHQEQAEPGERQAAR